MQRNEVLKQPECSLQAGPGPAGGPCAQRSPGAAPLAEECKAATREQGCNNLAWPNRSCFSKHLSQPLTKM